MDLAYAALLIGAFIGGFLHRSIIARIRDQHPDVWASLGSPSFPMNYSVKINLQVRKFLKSPECERLEDDVLTSRIQNERRFGLVYSVALVGIFLFMLAR